MSRLSVLCRVGLHHGVRLERTGDGVRHLCPRCGRASDVVPVDAISISPGWPACSYGSIARSSLS
jgi:hypothetical protein